MKSDLEIDLLRAFVVVAENKSFTRAAEQLNCVQSAVSMQIRRLEAAVGARLFDRTRRRVALTSQGEQLLVYAHRMLQLNAEALSSFGKASVQGRVRLGVTDTSMVFLPPVLSRFAASYPLVELEIRCDRSWHSLSALEAGEIELALVTQSCGRSGGAVVRREPLVWAVAQGSAVDRQDPLPLALFGPGCVYREAALAVLDEVGRSWRHAYNSASRDGLDVAVAAGLAVTILPQSALTKDLRKLGPAQDFPALPAIEILLFGKTGQISAPIAALADAVALTLNPESRNAA